MVKNPPANAGDTRNEGLIPGLGRSSGVGNGNPLQYSCLKNFLDRGAWQATDYGVAKNHTQLNTHIYKIDNLFIPLYSTDNSTQYFVIAYMEKESKKEWI